MTRKDYEKAAKIVRAYLDQPGSKMTTAVSISVAFAMLFEGDNPRFSHDRFRDACFPSSDAGRPKFIELRDPRVTP
jgi:hypothetical protein